MHTKFRTDPLTKQFLDTLIFINPDKASQREFANIVEKVAGIKTCYQQSLTELETLYGILSQQAFKGELDLSRVPLPGIKSEEEKALLTEPLPACAAESLAINLPDISESTVSDSTSPVATRC